MAVAQQIACFILWLVIVPGCAGILGDLLLEKRPRHIGTTFLMGWMLMASVFQALAVPFIILNYKLSELSRVFMFIMGILAVTGVVAAIISMGNDSPKRAIEQPSIKGLSKNEIGTWIFFAVIFIFQLVMSVIYMTPDGDDSYYITHAGIAAGQDKMYRIHAYTGVDGAPDYRHALAPFSMFIAFLSKRSGLHVAIVAHTVLPLVLIPISYLIYFRIAKLLFEKEKEKVSAFMVIIAGVQIFGATSFYSAETFFLTRTWQGKSILANVIIPMMFYLLLTLSRYTEQKECSKLRVFGIYFAMFITNFAGALMSSLGLFILCVLDFTFLVIISIRNKKMWMVPTGILTMLPCALFMGLYVLL